MKRMTTITIIYRAIFEIRNLLQDFNYQLQRIKTTFDLHSEPPTIFADDNRKQYKIFMPISKIQCKNMTS